MAAPERLLPRDLDPVAWLAALDPAVRRRAIELLGPEERDALDRAWPAWAHPGQRAPAAGPDGRPWRTWVLMAGRGFGKTYAGAKWVTGAIAGTAGTVASDCPQPHRPLRIALVGATLDDARRVMVEGPSGLLAVADAWVKDWTPSLRRLTFRTGAEAALFSGASPELLRGPEHHLAWCDELAKWEKPQESWDMLQLGLRLGDNPRALVTTTPRPGPVLKSIMAAPDCAVTTGRTRLNPHTSPAWRRAVHAQYAGTRLGRQELDGELLPDTPGALWSVELLERCRAKPSPCRGEGRLAEGERGEGTRYGADAVPSPHPSAASRLPPCSGRPVPRTGLSRAGRGSPEHPLQGEGSSLPCPRFTRIVIAVDPPTGDGTCGIIACARDADGHAHILADHSVTARTPEGWSSAVADAARIWSVNPPRDGEGDRAQRGGGGPETVQALVVAEKNQGGAMVAAVLHTADPALKVKPVSATVGKAERAAPVAMLFEAGRVTLHGHFPELEAQLLGMIAGGEYEGPGTSPDRADAMVWALTELMLTKERAPPRVRVL